MWTTLTGPQEDTMKQVADFYLPAHGRVLDVSYGAGRLTSRLENVTGVDIDRRAGADVVADSADLPFDAGSYQSAVFDPPYLYGRRAHNTLHGRPNNAWSNAEKSKNKDAGEFAQRAFDTAEELYRVLVPGGRVVAKVMAARYKGRLVANHCITIEAFESAGFDTFDILVYLKGGPGLFKQERSAQPTHGYYLVFEKPAAAISAVALTMLDGAA
jgi:SAM-dependent methyltransferase